MNKRKLIALLCLLILPMAVLAQGQKVTLKVSQMPLPNALRQVEQQSGYYKINYPYEAVKDYKVTADVKNVTAPDAVKALINGLPLSSTVEGRFIHVTKSDKRAESGGSRRTVKGQVVDTDGEPLIGVTVRVSGTDIGVVTDLDGNYVIEDVDPNSTLVFSYIGKKTVERKAASSNSVLILEDNANVMDDVVVTGYQQISKERTTGSFAKVTADNLMTKRYDNLSQLLEGEIAGFNTQSGLIRGTTTMNGVTNPLYVIDGFPVESTRYDEWGSLNESVPNVDINEIESITVLKDAAAASIYGARAANGVVVIVTKKAKGKRTNVSFSTSLTWHPYSFNKNRLTDAADIIDLEREWAAANPNLQGEGAADYARSIINDKVYTSQGIQTIANYYAGNISQSEMESRLNQLASQGYRYYDDVAKYAKRDAFYQQYHLSVGRSSDNNNFSAAITYRNNKMNDKFTNDNSWGIDLRDQLDVTNWLSLGIGSYTYYKKGNQQAYDPMSPGYSFMPYDCLRNDDGTHFTSTQESRLGQSDLAILTGYALPDYNITPLDEIGRNIRVTNEFINRTYGKLDFDLPWNFKYNVMFQYEYAYDRTRQLYEKDSYHVRNLVGQYATDDYGTGEATLNVPYGNIFYRANQTSKAYTFRQQLNYENTFADKHNVVALLGHEVRKTVIDYDNNTLYNYDPDMLSFSMVDQNVLYNTYGLMGGYGLNPSDFASLRNIDNRFVSLFANAAYTYDNKYMFSASIRWDRSNLWGTGSKYQNKPIWSIGAGWNIDREPWFRVDWVNRLKLRASYGIAGNIAKDAAPYMTASYYNNPNVGGVYGSVSTRPNPNLRWEKTTTTNVGLDFALLNNRLNGSIEFYNKMGTDLLANTMGVPTEGFGYTTYRINNGKMRNRGVELSLNGQIVRTADFSFDAGVTYSYNKNKVVYVNVEAPVYFLQLDYPDAYPIVGNPYNAIYAYKWAGLSADGLPQVLDAAGEATTYNPSDLAAIIYAGSTEPTHLASLNLHLGYKRFDLSCMWLFQGGHKMRNTDLPMLNSAYNYSLWSYVSTLDPVNKDIANRWRQPGDEAKTDIPAAIFAENPLFSDASRTIYGYADNNVISATNLRLANISLAYNLPGSCLRNIGLSSARLQFNVENAVTFAKSTTAKYLLGGYNAPNYVFGLYLDF